MANQQRTETINVKLPAGTLAGTYDTAEKLDTAYQRAVGVTVYENSNGGLPYSQMAILDDVNTYVSLTNTKHLQAGIDCPKPLRLTPLAIRISGANLKVRVALPEALTTELNLDVVFTLERPDSGN